MERREGQGAPRQGVIPSTLLQSRPSSAPQKSGLVRSYAPLFKMFVRYVLLLTKGHNRTTLHTKLRFEAECRLPIFRVMAASGRGVVFTQPKLCLKYRVCAVHTAATQNGRERAFSQTREEEDISLMKRNFREGERERERESMTLRATLDTLDQRTDIPVCLGKQIPVLRPTYSRTVAERRRATK